MALGHLDSNGVWIFGEDDSPDGTASGLLNLGQTKTSLAFTADRVRLTAIEGFRRVCSLRKSANQSLTTSAVAVAWDVEVSDVQAMHDNVTNNTRIVLAVAGLYEVTCMVFDSTTTGFGTVYGRINGTTDVAGSLARRDVMASGVTVPILTTFVVNAAAGDYLEIMALHSVSGGAVSSGSGSSGSYVTVKRIV